MRSTSFAKTNQFLYKHFLWTNWQIPQQTTDQNFAWIKSLLNLVFNTVDYEEWKFIKARQQFNGAYVKIGSKDYPAWPFVDFTLVPLPWFWQHTLTNLHVAVGSVNSKQGEWVSLLNLLQNWFYMFGVSGTKTRFISRVSIGTADVPFFETNNKTNDSCNSSAPQKYRDYARTVPFDKSSIDRNRSLQMASCHRTCKPIG